MAALSGLAISRDRHVAEHSSAAAATVAPAPAASGRTLETLAPGAEPPQDVLGEHVAPVFAQPVSARNFEQSGRVVDHDAPDVGRLGDWPIGLVNRYFELQALESGHSIAQPRKTVLALPPRTRPFQSFSTLSIEHDLIGS